MPQAPHLEDVVAVYGVDDAPCAQEQERLEEGVVVEMEDPGREGPHPQSEHHVPELRNRRVGDHPLYVLFRQRHRRRHKRCEAADIGHHKHCGGALDEDVVGTRH
jgi:hypothetical protein